MFTPKTRPRRRSSRATWSCCCCRSQTSPCHLWCRCGGEHGGLTCGRQPVGPFEATKSWGKWYQVIPQQKQQPNHVLECRDDLPIWDDLSSFRIHSIGLEKEDRLRCRPWRRSTTSLSLARIRMWLRREMWRWATGEVLANETEKTFIYMRSTAHVKASWMVFMFQFLQNDWA